MSEISRTGPQSGVLSESSIKKTSKNKGNFSAVLARAGKDGASAPLTPQAKESLGVITAENYTVSHLLVRNSKFAADTWNIIHSPINQNKDFTKIQPGAQVWIDPETKEISWRQENLAEPAVQTRKNVHVRRSPDFSKEADSLAESLVRAVSQEIGKNYEDVDCYELVVKGLSSLGIQYSGRGGLKDALMNRALASSLPSNAYLTGEGLVNACGNNLFNGTYININDPDALAKEVYESLGPNLRHGGILSLSTRTRGHTGVVAARDDQWTYINSGRMDNNIGDRVPSLGVGQEDLLAELRNWFRLAKSRGEALSVSLGELNREKLMAYAAPTPGPILV